MFAFVQRRYQHKCNVIQHLIIVIKEKHARHSSLATFTATGQKVGVVSVLQQSVSQSFY